MCLWNNSTGICPWCKANLNPHLCQWHWQNMKSLWLMLWMHEHYSDRKMNNQPITVYLWSCGHKNLTNNKWQTSSLVDAIFTYNSIKVNPTLHTPSSASYFFFCGDVSVLFLFSWEKRKEKFNNVYKGQKNFILILFFLGGGLSCIIKVLTLLDLQGAVTLVFSSM